MITQHTIYHLCDEDREEFYTVTGEFPAPSSYEGNPIRDWIIEKAGVFIAWIDLKEGECWDYEVDLGVIDRKPVRLWFYGHLMNLATTIWEAFYDGSIQHYDFQIEHPPCLFPDYHGLPEFGSYPIIKTS